MHHGLCTASRRAAGALCLALVGATILVLAVSCTTGRSGVGAAPVTPYPAVSFAVMSDTHVYDRSLGTTGQAFDRYLAEDRKLLAESEEIFQEALRAVVATDARFLVISGDLTKDGEESSHRLVAEHLLQAERSGLAVYVVPGNHDVRNPDAARFVDDRTEPVKYLEPEEFSAIYAEFGYSEALERDPASLSYVAEPVSGLWLLCLDSTDTARNLSEGTPQTNGRLSPARRRWLEHVLERAGHEGKAVIAVLHHGLVPHFASEDRYFGEYLLDGFTEIGRLLARSGVRVAFTGHFHAQDIALRRFGAGAGFGETFLFDVETGSLVTWPCAYRLIRIEQGTMRIDSPRVSSLPSFAGRGEDFGSYARQSTWDGVAGISVNVMVSHGLRRAEAESLSGQIADAFLAHYAGDEHFTGTDVLRTAGLSLMGRLVVGSRKNLVKDLWRDSETADNDVVLRLDTGAWTREETVGKGSP